MLSADQMRKNQVALRKGQKIKVAAKSSKDDTNILENKKVESKISKRCYDEKLMDTANVTNNSAEPAIQGMICKYPIFIPFTKKLYVSKM